MLQKVLGNPEATWTSEVQQEAITAVLALESDVVAIMRTGAGKSMLAIIPSMIEDAVTLLVLPLKSLVADYVRKLEAMDVGFELFESTTSVLHGHANLVIVSADMARTAQWRQAVHQLHTHRQIARLVFDEGHFAFTSSSFRPALQDIYELRQIPMQLVVLTAT